MAKFYMWSNNGVTAVVTEAVFQEMEHRRNIEGEVEEQGKELRLPPARPVFTFSGPPNSGLKEWLTGTVADMEVLLEGHEVVRKSFYVPFSNGYQWGSMKLLLGDNELAEREQRFRTTLGEAMDAFGLVPKHLIETYGFDRTAKT